MKENKNKLLNLKQLLMPTINYNYYNNKKYKIKKKSKINKKLKKNN